MTFGLSFAQNLCTRLKNAFKDKKEDEEVASSCYQKWGTSDVLLKDLH